MNRQERRSWKRLRVVGAVAVIAFLVLTTFLFVFPRTDVPRRVDAIVVLGGASNKGTKTGLGGLRSDAAYLHFRPFGVPVPHPRGVGHLLSAVTRDHPGRGPVRGQARVRASLEPDPRGLRDGPDSTRPVAIRPLLPRHGVVRPGGCEQRDRVGPRCLLRMGCLGQGADHSTRLLTGGLDRVAAGRHGENRRRVRWVHVPRPASSLVWMASPVQFVPNNGEATTRPPG